MNLRCKKAAELMVKDRASNLTYSDVETKFAKYTWMESLVAVRGALSNCDLNMVLILCCLLF